jgi:hypothetical protein
LDLSGAEAPRARGHVVGRPVMQVGMNAMLRVPATPLGPARARALRRKTIVTGRLDDRVGTRLLATSCQN